jgi:ABC-type glycerol-3-phosphate transport system substrate-binding protein
MTCPRLRVVSAMLVCLAIAACGGDDSEPGGTAKADPKELSGTITVWRISSHENRDKAAAEIDERFKAKYPGVTIKNVSHPLSDYDQVLQAAFTGRRGPEVMMLVGSQQGVLRWTQGLERLNDRISDEMRQNVSGWEATSADFDPDGDVYGIPQGASLQLFYYNKRLFKKAGLDPEAPPESWDQMLEYAEKLKAAGVTPFASGNKEGFENSWWFSVGAETTSEKDAIADLALGRTSFQSPVVKSALEVQKRFQDAGAFPEDRFSTPLLPDGAASFAAQEGAMYLGLGSTAAYYGDFLEPIGEKNLGVFLPPQANFVGVEPVMVWSIPKFAKNKDAAWTYIDFITNAESMETMYKVGGVLPNDKRVPVAQDAPAQQRQIIDWLNTHETFPSPHQMIPGKVLGEYGTAMSEALQGRRSLDEVMQTMQQANDG